MQTGNDFSSNIGVDKFFGKFEMFSKDIELPALKTEKEGRKEGIGIRTKRTMFKPLDKT